MQKLEIYHVRVSLVSLLASVNVKISPLSSPHLFLIIIVTDVIELGIRNKLKRLVNSRTHVVHCRNFDGVFPEEET